MPLIRIARNGGKRRRKSFRLLAAGMIRPPIWARLPLAEAGKAQAMIEGGRVLGKVILKP